VRNAPFSSPHWHLALPESQFTGDQAEALRKLMHDCQIALIKRYD
jgi:hypothetical protein